jgi:chaperonin cofactor prefoldin
MSALDPVVAAELEELEAALRGDADAPTDLLALTRDVRAAEPPMTMGFRARLDRDVAAGFPRRGGRRAWSLRWPSMQVTGALAAVLLALVVATVVIAGRGGSTPAGNVTASGPASTSASSGAAAADATATESAPAPAPEARKAAPSVAAGAGAATSTAGGTTSTDGGRSVEHSVDLTLQVDQATFLKATDEVVQAAQASGGYVSASNLGRTEAQGTAIFTLRIPVDRLDQAVNRLSSLGHVAALNRSSEDLTSQVDSLQAKLDDARDQRSALLKALGNASTDNQAKALQQRLALVRKHITSLQSQQGRLRSRTQRSTVAVTITTKDKSGLAIPPKHDDRWTPGDAARDAVRVLESIAGGAIIALAILLPLGLLAFGATTVSRSTRRRRREHALDLP